MNERRRDERGFGRYVSAEDLQRYTGLGRNYAARIGKDCGAAVKVGRRVVYDLRKIDEYMESQALKGEQR